MCHIYINNSYINASNKYLVRLLHEPYIQPYIHVYKEKQFHALKNYNFGHINMCMKKNSFMIQKITIMESI